MEFSFWFSLKKEFRFVFLVKNYVLSEIFISAALPEYYLLLPNGSVKLLLIFKLPEIASFSWKTTFLNGYKIFLEYTITLVFLQYDILFQEE